MWSVAQQKAFPQRFVRFLCLWKNIDSSHFCSCHLNRPGELRLSTRSQCNLFIFKLFGSLRVYPYSSIPSSRRVPSRLRRRQTFLPFPFCKTMAQLQSLLQENTHTFSLVRLENNDGCRSIPDLQIRGRSTLNSRFFWSFPAFHAGLATCGWLLAPNSIALPKGFPPSLLLGSLALFGFSS